MKDKFTIPWQSRPDGSSELLWRFDNNPLTGHRPIPGVLAIYNSAVISYEGAFIGVFRGDQQNGMPTLFVGHSDDGIAWTFETEPIPLQGEDAHIGIHEYAYDPRIVRLDDRYIVQWCNGYHGPTIGLAETHDFKTFIPLENAFLPYNRNGVLFPRKIGDNYAMLSRPSDTGHTPFGDIFYSESPDLTYWGKHRHVMSKGPEWWQGLKIGPGPIPIETSEGWLMIYHGVCNTCNGFVYRMGVALLDLDKPWKVISSGKGAIFGPEKPYETTGLVPNVTFPCAVVQDAGSDRIAVYYGSADTHIALAFGHINELVDFALQR
ncbi:MAG: glycosidase [Lentisphaerae bacterium]|jgi:beta-1,4-mannooligosaccharide/beta-1,4-mannosyl-N-acetylglucosamine phosphorylase|nr:glycosidase [Lentisphaerota bacterium]